jgi:ribosomal protein S18 acetylase RimI-like enzyme
VGGGDALRVRDATRADHDALCALWRVMDELHASLHPGWFRRRGWPRPPSELERILRASDERLRVADEDGAVVGLCHLQLYDTPPIPWMTPSRRAHLDSLVVDTGARRRGVGRRLLDDAAAWARGRGAGELVLTVWNGNEDAARFYASLGFGPVNSVLGRPL